jgi:transposase
MSTLFVGCDVHNNTIAVAVAEAGRDGDVRSLGTIPNTLSDVNKLLKRLSRDGKALDCCYEAGPCGYGLYRQVREAGHACRVVAPSEMPQRPGDRIKTDHRDALLLARMHRAGELDTVWVPDQAHEAMRDLVRARMTAKLQVSARLVPQLGRVWLPTKRREGPGDRAPRKAGGLYAWVHRVPDIERALKNLIEIFLGRLHRSHTWAQQPYAR